MAFNAQRAAQRYKDAMGSSQTKQAYKDGILGFAGNPMEMAAAHADDYKRGTEEAATSGRFAARLRETPKQKWVDGGVNKGADRLSTGAAAAFPVALANFQRMAPIYDQMKVAADAVQRTGDREADARRKWEAANAIIMAAGRRARR